ncbi:MAG: hypothetical protein IJR46_03705, partial [Neisseriaceae bacterium]|nr:hypothetical protein [Neisseriaceae bacterium]
KTISGSLKQNNNTAVGWVSNPPTTPTGVDNTNIITDNANIDFAPNGAMVGRRPTLQRKPNPQPSLRASKASVAIFLLWKTHQIYTATKRLPRLLRSFAMTVMIFQAA